jgi:hypothetical protein
MFRAVGGAYAINAYDLPTDNEEDILEILQARGWNVLEIYGIKEQ